MDRKATFPARWSVLALTVPLLAAVSGVTKAEVTAFEVISEESYGSFEAGDYVRITGKVTGELSTSESVPDLARADEDGDGKVEYTTDLLLIVPADPRDGNGALLVDIENRGRPVLHSLYNSPRDVPLPTGSLNIGTGFLQDRGFLLAVPSWELGQGIEPPTFANDDGTTRYVEGVGLAAVRDIAAWLRGVDADVAGDPNPLVGAVDRALATGYSQTARFSRPSFSTASTSWTRPGSSTACTCREATQVCSRYCSRGPVRNLSPAPSLTSATRRCAAFTSRPSPTARSCWRRRATGRNPHE